MTLDRTRIKLLCLALALVIAVPAFAGRRRAVGHPTAGTAFQATVKGQVVDAVTGQPVVFAAVTFGDRADFTAADGSFFLPNATAYGSSATVIARRSGYNDAVQTISGAGTHTITIRIQPKPTVNVRLVNGTVVPFDIDELKIGHVVVFVGWDASEEANVCRTDGSKVVYPTSQIKRIVGPSVKASLPACCDRELERVRIELRNGEAFDAYFNESCFGYPVEVIGRHHITAQMVNYPFSQIAEVAFP